jgi:hypothetical protein
MEYRYPQDPLHLDFFPQIVPSQVQPSVPLQEALSGQPGLVLLHFALEQQLPQSVPVQLQLEEVVVIALLPLQQFSNSLELTSVAGSDSLLPQQSDASVGVGTNIFTANAPAKTNPPARSETISTRLTILSC